MKFTATTAVLSTLAASQLAAAGVHSRHARHNHAARHEKPIEARSDEHIEARGVLDLVSLGVSALGLNPTALLADDPTPWIGTTGQYTNTFYNKDHRPVTLVMWKNGQSWVNKYVPWITVTIPSNSSKTISFQDGMSGAWTGVYEPFDLTQSWGQIAETWGEFTFVKDFSTVDVSREVNMQGSNMKIITPNCVSSMTQCVFMCVDRSLSSCKDGYELVNCDQGAQGPDYGLGGAPSGGCQGITPGTRLLTFLGGDQ